MKHLHRYFHKHELPYMLTVIVLGTLNHFLYKLSGQSTFVALFCPVNESIWEHLKLLFFPYLFVSIYEYIHRRPAFTLFFYSRYLAVLCGMGFTISAFYTYTGTFGEDFLPIDILIFLGSVFFSFLCASYFYIIFQSFRKIRSGSSHKRIQEHLPSLYALGSRIHYYFYHPTKIQVCILWIFSSLCFFAFTCYPPDIPLFFSSI